MKEDIILLAESKGFISKILFAFNNEDFPFTTEEEVENFDKLKRYLWLCELQRWLREVHNIDAIPYLVEMRSNNKEVKQDKSDKEYLYRLYKNGISEYEFFEEEMNYKEALEKALYEALKL